MTEPVIVYLKNARSSYAHVYKARAIEEGKEPRYSMDVYLDPSNADHAKQILAVKQEVARVGKERFPDLDVKKLEVPFAVVDEADSPFSGQFKLKMWNKTRPLVVDRNRNPTVGEEDTDHIYSGCRVNTNPTFFPWEYKNKQGVVLKRGVSANLRSVQFVADDEPLAGRAAPVADDEFEAIGDAAAKAGGASADPFA